MEAEMVQDNGVAMQEPDAAMDIDDIEQEEKSGPDLSSTTSPSQATGHATARSNSACANPSTAKNALPLARIKTIMRSAPDSMAIGADAVFAVTKATEYFIGYLANAAHSGGGSATSIEYKDLANTVDNDKNLQFLKDVVPKKILARDYLATLQSPN